MVRNSMKHVTTFLILLVCAFATRAAVQLDLRLLLSTDLHMQLLDHDDLADRPVTHYGLVRTATLIRRGARRAAQQPAVRQRRPAAGRAPGRLAGRPAAPPEPAPGLCGAAAPALRRRQPRQPRLRLRPALSAPGDPLRRRCRCSTPICSTREPADRRSAPACCCSAACSTPRAARIGCASACWAWRRRRPCCGTARCWAIACARRTWSRPPATGCPACAARAPTWWW